MIYFLFILKVDHYLSCHYSRPKNHNNLNLLQAFGVALNNNKDDWFSCFR